MRSIFFDLKQRLYNALESLCMKLNLVVSCALVLKLRFHHAQNLESDNPTAALLSTLSLCSDALPLDPFDTNMGILFESFPGIRIVGMSSPNELPHTPIDDNDETTPRTKFIHDLVTNRDVYTSFLEQEVERVSASCLNLQRNAVTSEQLDSALLDYENRLKQYDASFNDISHQVQSGFDLVGERFNEIAEILDQHASSITENSDQLSWLVRTFQALQQNDPRFPLIPLSHLTAPISPSDARAQDSMIEHPQQTKTSDTPADTSLAFRVGLCEEKIDDNNDTMKALDSRVTTTVQNSKTLYFTIASPISKRNMIKTDNRHARCTQRSPHANSSAQITQKPSLVTAHGSTATHAS